MLCAESECLDRERDSLTEGWMSKTKVNDAVGAGSKAGSKSISSGGFVLIVWAAVAAVGVIGLLDIIGTIFDVTVLTSVAPQWMKMRIITAACFLLCALELGLVEKRGPAVRGHFALQLPAIN